MNKVEAKEKRREILAEIDVLEKQRCKNCSVSTLNTAMVHCDCPPAVEIRRLGALYENIATEARKGRLQGLYLEGHKNGLTLDLYNALRELEQKNDDIYKGLRMKESAYYDWKFEVGLIKERRPARNVEKMIKSRKKNAKAKKKHIEQKYIDIAKKNGIPKHVVYHRVFSSKQPLKQAITEPILWNRADYRKWVPIAEQNGISFSALKSRVLKGEPFESAAVRPSKVRETVK